MTNVKNTKAPLVDIKVILMVYNLFLQIPTNNH